MPGLEGDHAPVQIDSDLAAPAAPGFGLESGMQAFAAFGNHGVAALERPSERLGGRAVATPPPAEHAADASISRSLARAVQERTGPPILARQHDPNATSEEPPAKEEAEAFTPTVSSTAGTGSARLGATTGVGVAVDNAADAPEGTTYSWKWETLDADLEDAGEGATGERTELQVKALSVGSFSATPQLEYVVDSTSYSLTGEAVTIEVDDISVAWDELEIEPGKRAPDVTRGVTAVYAGDKLTLRARVTDCEGPEDVGVEPFIGSPGTAAPSGSWVGRQLRVDLGAAEQRRIRLRRLTHRPGRCRGHPAHRLHRVHRPRSVVAVVPGCAEQARGDVRRGGHPPRRCRRPRRGRARNVQAAHGG